MSRKPTFEPKFGYRRFYYRDKPVRVSRVEAPEMVEDAPVPDTLPATVEQRQPEARVAKPPVSDPCLLLADGPTTLQERVEALVSLKADQCRFPKGDVRSGDMRYCGSSTAFPGSPYCRYHRRRAYV